MSSTGVGDRSFRFDATPHGKPAVESALLRWITSILGLILGALAAVGYVIWIITSFVILIQED